MMGERVNNERAKGKEGNERAKKAFFAKFLK